MSMANEFVRGELIGLEVLITDSKNKSLIGVQGKIVDETKNMFIIKTKDSEEKKIIKNQCTFEFTLDNREKVAVEGENLVARPEMRLKKTQTKKRV